MHSYAKYKHAYIHSFTRIHSYKHLLSFQLDIDMCNETHNCSQICTKTNGSFICECNSGYLLDIDGVTCNGMHIWYLHTNIHIHT